MGIGRILEVIFLSPCSLWLFCAVSLASAETAKTSVMTLSSSDFESGGVIPRRFTGDGEDSSPQLHWDNVPAGVRELVLIVDDPDSPTRQPWVH